MNKEQIYFLSILGDYLKGEHSKPSDVDYGEVYSYACSHQLQTIFYKQCKEYIADSSSFSMIKKNQYAVIVNWAQRNRVAKKIIDGLYDKNIEFSIVKGYEIEKLYQSTSDRIMGDIDVIVHPRDIDKVDLIITSLGFLPLKRFGDEWSYHMENVLVEIHTSMIHPHDGNKQYLDYFNNLWKHGRIENKYFKLDWNFHFCYLIQHLSGHMIYTGIGFRHFLDIALVILNVDLDWCYIEKELRQLGLWFFTQKCVSFCQKWFCVDFPVSFGDIDNSLYEIATDKIFSDGVYGRNNPDNEIGLVVGDMLYSKKSQLHVYSKSIIQLIFPPCSKMVRDKDYSFLSEKRYLLPVAWLHRIVIKGIKLKSRAKWSEIIKPMNDNELLDNRLNYLHEWGL